MGASAEVHVTREQVLAYRVAAQQLDRSARSPQDVAVLDIGIQEAMGSSASLIFDARLPAASTAPVGPESVLALGWTLRGAPHLHRRCDLDELAGALWPLSEADARFRLGETGRTVTKSGMSALDAFGLAVAAVRAVVTQPMGKGAVSTAVTRKLPAPMGRECRGCKTTHVSDPTLRLATLPAGIEFEPGASPPVLVPRVGAAYPEQPDRLALQRLILAYLRLLGPATSAEVASYLEGRRVDVAEVWPDGLAEVHVDGRAAWLPEEQLPALTAAPAPELVRLLGPFDPFLQARDRDVLVPDPVLHKALWPVLGRPGVLLVDGEVTGTWRPKLGGGKLTLTVEPFGPLPPSVWRQVTDEATRVAATRGATEVHVAKVE